MIGQYHIPLYTIYGRFIAFWKVCNSELSLFRLVYVQHKANQKCLAYSHKMIIPIHQMSKVIYIPSE